MKTCAHNMHVHMKRMLAAMMAAASLCMAGCAEKTDDNTFVMIDVGYLDSEQEFIEKYGTDGTYVAISGFTTPEPVITPVPTPEATPRPTAKPKAGSKSDKDKQDKKTEAAKADPTPTPAPSQKKTPYASKYDKVSLSYESSSDGIKFETTTLSGDAVSESIFGKNSITMITIWTQT